jgi:type III secretion system needle length determinant
VRPVNFLPPLSRPVTDSEDERERRDEPSVSERQRFKKALQAAADRKETQQRVAEREETQQRAAGKEAPQRATDRRDTQQRAGDRKEPQRRAADEPPQDRSALESAERLMSRRGLGQAAAAPAPAPAQAAPGPRQDSVAAGDKPSDAPDDAGETPSQSAAEMAAASRMGAEPRMPGGPARRGEERGRATPDSDEADPRGNDAPKGRERKSSVQQGTGETAAPLASVADRILNNLSSKPEEPSAPPPGSSGADLAEVVRAVADRMMVGASGPGGQQEVRIVLKNQVLGGTEIRLSEVEGSLQVHFLAGSPQAESLLRARRQEISSALGERLRRSVRVEVTDRESEQEPAGEDATHASGRPPARR